MSERHPFRTAAGVALLVGAALLLFLPLLPSGSPAVKYRPAENRRTAPVVEEAGAEDGKRVSVNHADAEELTALPGIGSVFADRIVEERRERGPFFYPEDLEAVSGIGLKSIDRLRPLLDLTE